MASVKDSYNKRTTTEKTRYEIRDVCLLYFFLLEFLSFFSLLTQYIFLCCLMHYIRSCRKKLFIYCTLEQEADAEEERLRKERERQQKQDVMTLGETREQISNLENELSHLKDEKHQLFLQLKKVLNEDDNRRRQLIKETRFDIQQFKVS